MKDKALKEEFEKRRGEIEKSLEELFKKELKITDWDIPEVNDREAAKILVEILSDKLHKIKGDIESGIYNNY